MRGLLEYEHPLFYLQLAALVGVVVRLQWSGLARIYRFFFAYLVVLLVEGLIPFFLNRTQTLYGALFLVTRGVIIVLYALIVLELYTLILKDLTGIATVARRYTKLAIAVATAIAFVIVTLERVPSSLLGRLYTVESTIVSSLVLFVLLITAFLVYYPIPLNRNVIYYSIGYAFYFSSKALALFLLNTGHGWYRAFSFAMLAVSTACLVFWTISLSARGEKKIVIFGHQWNSRDEERVLGQLKAINASLLRARK